MIDIKPYKLIFITGCLDHISLPLYLEFLKEYGDDFLFISTLPFPNSRKEIGYGSFETQYPNIFKTYESQKNYMLGKKLIYQADIVLYGTCKDDLISRRLKSDKITFKMSERFFKTPTTHKNWLKRKIGIFIHYKRFTAKNKYILCMGGYVANDLEKVKLFRGKRLVWAYFTKISDLNFDTLSVLKSNTVFQLIWVGRFISLKHPEMVVELARYLKTTYQKNFVIKMVGYGPLLDECKEMARICDVDDVVHFTGPLSLEEKEIEMNKSNILLFTSDRQEGWGAVVNEAMGSACAVVASLEAGSSSSLIKDNYNGRLFNALNQDELNLEVIDLMENRGHLESIQEQAYEDAHHLWNVSVAAKRLISIFRNLLNGNELLFEEEGPCSEAKPL